LLSALQHFLARVANGLAAILNYRLGVLNTTIEWTVLSHVDYLGLAVPMVSGAVMILGVTVVIALVAVMMMVMTVVVAFVAVIMMVMTTSGWRTVGMRAPTAMFVVAIIMLAFALVVIVVIGCGCRNQTWEGQHTGK
jgi:hypothetical protein